MSIDSFKVTLIFILLMNICSCAVVPNVESKYDEQCKAYDKKVVLSIDGEWTPEQLECSNKEECKSDVIPVPLEDARFRKSERFITKAHFFIKGCSLKKKCNAGNDSLSLPLKGLV